MTYQHHSYYKIMADLKEREYIAELCHETSMSAALFSSTASLLNNKEKSFEYSEQVNGIINKLRKIPSSINYIQDLDVIIKKVTENNKLPYNQEVKNQNEITIELLGIIKDIIIHLASQIQEANNKLNPKKTNILLRLKHGLFNILTKK